MGLVSIGPVSIAHGDPDFSWEAAPTSGVRPASIGGSASWAAVKTLSELVANPQTRQTIGGRTGVLEWIEFDDNLLGDLTGYYLLESFGFSPSQQHSLTDDDVPFTLNAAYLGDMA